MTDSRNVDILEQCKETCRENPGTVVFPDCLDERVVEVAVQLKKEGLAEPVLVSSPFKIRDKMTTPGIQGMGLTVVDAESPTLLSKNVEAYMALRKKRDKPVSENEAVETMRSPIAASAMMVRRGEVEISVAGNLTSTANVIRAGLNVLRKKPGIDTVSSFFFMLSPDGKRKYLFADCAVIPDPSSDILADIAIMSAEKARNLLREEPRVALLSFSTKGSSRHHRAGVVSEAVEKIRKRASDMKVDGELQFDAAMVPSIAALKAPGSIIEGEANVFIFPSLEAGNIAYKMIQRLAGYTAMGPFLQGFEGGWHDLSRGCSAKDIFKVAVVGLCLERGNLLN